VWLARPPRARAPDSQRPERVSFRGHERMFAHLRRSDIPAGSSAKAARLAEVWSAGIRPIPFTALIDLQYASHAARPWYARYPLARPSTASALRRIFCMRTGDPTLFDLIHHRVRDNVRSRDNLQHQRPVAARVLDYEEHRAAVRDTRTPHRVGRGDHGHRLCGRRQPSRKRAALRPGASSEAAPARRQRVPGRPGRWRHRNGLVRLASPQAVCRVRDRPDHTGGCTTVAYDP
jgi:hypothetical protein